MRKVVFLFSFVFALAFSSTIFDPAAGKSPAAKGDYVEARTASVFAGACHYNGEVVTTGREALMAWSFTSGEWRGVDLSGVRVMAVVSAGANLAEVGAPRKAELVVDSAVSDSKAAAVVDALTTRYASALGETVAVRRAPVSFRRHEKTYSVNAGDLAVISVEAMPNDECCKMPHLIWYSPLVPLANRKVGFTESASYSGGAAGVPWKDMGANSAFYGSFSF